MAYWITQTLAATPAFVWLYFGVGLLMALALLPRAQGRDPLALIGIAPLLGALTLTGVIFVLGSAGANVQAAALTNAAIQGALLLIAVLCAGMILLKRRGVSPTRGAFAWDTRLLLALMAAAWGVRWVTTAYWPFTAYDTLWVYGYEGRLFSLLGHIPNAIGYYPPLIASQYAYGQIAWGQVGDHIARAGLPLLHLASFGAVYTLGARLFGRRVGVYAAALWALYPHVGEWSRAGDLEIALASWFALAAAFFLAAWMRPARWHKAWGNAALAGVMLAGGLWTKPTMGAFVWGVLLLCALEIAQCARRGQLWTAWPRLRIGLVALSIGGLLGGGWYLRNILLGHAPIELPGAFWQTQAARSGAEFGWPLLALAAYLVFIGIRFPRARPELRRLLPGLFLIGAGVVPTLYAPARMGVLEYGLLAAGVLLTGWALIDHARRALDIRLQRDARVFGWTYALALPYFITWFWSYSYHYRLSFAIVPLLLLPIARFAPALVHGLSVRVPRAALALTLIALAIPALLSPIYDTYTGWDYLLTDEMPDDAARYRSGNPALMAVVDGLDIWKADHPGERLTVAAPGIQALPFFFPLDDIRTTDSPLDHEVETSPTQLGQITDVDYYVYGAPESGGAYATVPALTNQIVSSLGRNDLFRRAWGMDDGIFRYDVYEPSLAVRFTPPQPNGAVDPQQLVTAGNPPFARYLGYDIGGLDLWEGRRVVMHLYWQVLATPPADWTTFVHLIDSQGRLVTTWDGPVAPYLNAVGETVYYSTRLWEAGEFIRDQRTLELPSGVPLGAGYRLVIGFYDSVANVRAPLSVNGAAADDGSYTIEDRIVVVPPR